MITEQNKKNVFYLLLCQDNSSKQLIFQAAHCDREIDDGGFGTHFRCVGGVTKLSGDVETEALHNIHFFVTYFDLKTGKQQSLLPS